MLKAKSTENLSNFDLLTFDLLGALEIRGVKRSDFIAKGTSLREYTSIEPFSAKVSWESDPPRAEIEKSQKVTRGSHRNDVSPLTQGLNYRSACMIND